MDISLENQMLKAVKDKNLDAVESLLNKGANPNKTTSNGKTCLGEAVFRGFTEIAVLLITKSQYVTENPPSSNEEGNCNAQNAYSHSLKILRKSLKDETKPLDKATRDSYNIEESKVAGGAVALSPSSPQTDLEWDEEMANVAETTSEDESVASMYKVLSRWYANILEFTGSAIAAASDYTCGIDQKDAYERTALSYAAERDNVEVVKALANAGCKVDLAERNGMTALHVSVAGKRIDTVRELLAAGSDVNLQTPVKTTALHIAACFSLDMLRLIEEKGGRLNVRDEKDRTAVYVAAALGHCDIVRYLIERGANCDLGDSDGHTPLCKAVHFKHYDTAKLLLEWGARITHYQCLLPAAIDIRHHRMVDLLASHRCGINVHGPSGETPLLKAMTLDDYPCEIATILLEKGANVNACNSLTGASALHVAVEFSEDHEDFQKLLNVLLDYQIDVDKRAFTRDTPLNRAILLHKDRIAMQLIRYGADVNLCEVLTNVFGNLIIASNRRRHKLAEMLINAGHCRVTLNLDNPKNTAKWITEQFKSPMSLADMCRVQIRTKRNRRVNLRDYVATLPLPEVIKKYLMMEEFVL